MQRKILLIGATGTFGTRLAELLGRQPALEIVLAARRRAPLEALRRRLVADGALAVVSTLEFDRKDARDLARIAPWLVVDAAGPFQGGDYDLARAAITCGAHYVDLADARDFVAGFAPALDGAARAADVFAATGVSSTPTLSHAALATLVAGWQHIDDVDIVISPGARAPRGLAVMQAILSYVGRPVRLFRGGRWEMAPGWSATRTFDMPGLGRRYASLCETPDLDLLPARFPIRRAALFRAGLELPIMRLGLAMLSVPVRLGIVPSLAPLARPLRAAADLLAPFGSDRGGMIVTATGHDAAGRRVHARWALWAAANAGPSVPAAPAAALVRALAAGRIAATGAQPGAGWLDVADIMHELTHLPIETRIDESLTDEVALFRRLVGSAFDRLPAPVRAVHAGETRSVFRGRAIARAGRSVAARLLRPILGVPPSGQHAVEVTIAPTRGGETWDRQFGASRFRSQLLDTGRLGIFAEQFGPVRFLFDLAAETDGFAWHLIGWRLGPLPLPRFAAPRIRAGATSDGARYRFRVVVAHDWLGLLFAYRGWLAP